MSDIDLLNCTSTRDCAERDGSIPRICYTSPVFSDVPLCDCSMYYGWQGLNCDEVSIGLLYRRIMTILLIIWSVTVMLLSTRIVILNWLFEGVTFTPVALTSYASLVATVGLLLYYLFIGPSFFDPTAFILTATPSYVANEDVSLTIYAEGIASARIALIVTFSPAIFASFALLVSWQNIISKVSYFEDYRAAEAVQKQHMMLKLVGAGLVALPLIFLAIGEVLGALACISLLSSFSAPFYYLVSKRLIDTLNFVSSVQRQHEVELIVKVVKKTRDIILLCFTVFSIFYTAFFLSVNSLEKTIGPGYFNYSAFFVDISFSAILSQLTIITWYVNSVSVGPIVAETWCPLLCLPFKFWDKMNRRLIPEETQTIEPNLSSVPATIPQEKTSHSRVDSWI